MTQWTLLSVAIFMVGNAVADILVQPGYGQPRSMLQPQPVVQPPATLQHVSGNQEFQQQETLQPDYHLELHPVYTNLHHPANVASYPLIQQHHLTPYLSKAAYRRLQSGKLSGVDHIGMAPIVSNQYVPLAVHSRYRRSSGDESSPGSDRQKLDEVNMATKSTLSENVPPVVDLQSQDGEATKNLDAKRVEVRQSNNGQAAIAGTLLGLNPSRMYPANYQYRIVENAPQNSNLNTYQQIISDPTHQQTLSQLNSRAATQEQTSMQNQATTSTQTAFPRMNHADLQHAVQQPTPQQQQLTAAFQKFLIDQLRNFPDPRPGSATFQASTDQTTKDLSEPQTPPDARSGETNDDKEIVATKFGLYKASKHQRGIFEAPSYATSESYTCPCTNPGYVVYNVEDATSNNLVPSRRPVQLYQLPVVQETNYPTNARYVVLPRIYNHVTNYDWGFLPSSPSRICSQNLDDVPSVTYQLV